MADGRMLPWSDVRPDERRGKPMTRGFILAAPSSGSGKTLAALGLLARFREQGVSVAGALCGPDYIGPRFHEAAAGRPSVNLDPWAMRPDLIRALLPRDADLLLVEGVGGLFDGAKGGAGSAADLAAMLGLPVVLVVDVRHQAQTAAAVALGCARLREDVHVAGVILNGVAGPHHAELAAERFQAAGVPLLGSIPLTPDFALPGGHTGIVQALAEDGLADLVEEAADAVMGVNMGALLDLAAPLPPLGEAAPPLAPLGQRIAVARDAAFAFAYPHLLDGWRRAGAEIMPFSPLADEAPDAAADAVFLPGGYPERHADQLTAAETFWTGLQAAASRNALIYGEGGGFMALGEALVDAAGTGHEMAGLLPLVAGIAEPKMHRGYRILKPLMGAPWKGGLRGHACHAASVIRAGRAQPLFHATHYGQREQGPEGMRNGRVMGSFLHVIDQA